MRALFVALGTGATLRDAQMNDSTTISRAFYKAARWQVIATALLALALLAFAGVHAAISALLGGTSVIVGCYVGVVATGGSCNTNPGAVLITLLKAEAIKIVVIVLLLLVTFKFYEGLVPLALIGGLASAALISGAGLRAVNNENQ